MNQTERPPPFEDDAERSRRSILRALEMIAAALCILLFSDALLGPLFNPTQLTTDSSLVLRYAWIPVYLVTALLVICHLRVLVEAFAPFTLFFLLVFVAGASMLWSIDGEVTLRRVIALAFTSLFGVYLGARFNRTELLTLLMGVLMVLAVGSLIACLFFPAIGVHQGVNAGAWRGLWYEKNEMGSIMAIGVFTCLSAAIVTRRTFAALAGLVLCTLLLLMSQSKTSLLCLFIPAVVMPLLWCVNRGPVTGLIALYGAGLAAAGAAVVFAAQPDLAFAALGKDASLTGRTDIWAAVHRLSAERPALGYGYGAFWEKESAPAILIRHQLKWLVPSAHNAWLDVLIQLGQLGLALSVGLVAVIALAALLRGGGVKDGYWAAIIVATFLVRSGSESIFLAYNNLEWVLFVAAATILLTPVQGVLSGRASPR